jgi:hypothetical protein
MKTCECCGAVTFDDMDTCYGCLSSFAREPKYAPVDRSYKWAEARLQLTMAGLFSYGALLRENGDTPVGFKLGYHSSGTQQCGTSTTVCG